MAFSMEGPTGSVCVKGGRGGGGGRGVLSVGACRKRGVGRSRRMDYFEDFRMLGCRHLLHAVVTLGVPPGLTQRLHVLQLRLSHACLQCQGCTEPLSVEFFSRWIEQHIKGGDRLVSNNANNSIIVISASNTSTTITTGIKAHALWTCICFPCKACMRHGWGKVP